MIQSVSDRLAIHYLQLAMDNSAISSRIQFSYLPPQFVNKCGAQKIKWSWTKFQFQFELSLAQLSPSLFIYLIIYTIYLDTPRVVGNPLQGASGRWNWCTLKCFCTYRLFNEYLWYFFHKCYSGIAYIYTFLAFLYGKSIVIFHRNKSFHSTVDALGVCIWSKKQKPIFGGVMAAFAECLD